MYAEVLRAGGLPIMQLSGAGAQASLFELASEEQLDWVAPTAVWAAENADVRIAMMLAMNARTLAGRPQKYARSNGSKL